jgi:hypothetical protein
MPAQQPNPIILSLLHTTMVMVEIIKKTVFGPMLQWGGGTYIYCTVGCLKVDGSAGHGHYSNQFVLDSLWPWSSSK